MALKDSCICKVVAIAKDEAPYVADWVFHHLRFGFKKVHVYINRTSDKTQEVLDKISEEYPSVTYELIDWVDLIPGNEVSKNIQQIAYAHSFYMSQADCDYVLYIDLDEFWVPLDFTSTISDCVKRLNHPDAISFEWENLQGEREPFSFLPRELYVKGNGHVKSLISVKAGLQKMRIHAPVLSKDNTHLLADGAHFSQARKIKPQVIDRDGSKAKDFFILHRMFRSEIEYIATLSRGVPNLEGFKTNRPGFLRADDRSEVISFEKDKYESYQRGRSDFYSRCGVVDLVKSAEAELVNRAKGFIRLLPVYCMQNIQQIKKVTSGIRNKEVVKTVRDMETYISHLDERLEGHEENVDVLRDIAFDCERNADVLAAYYFMLKARNIRPKGGVINRSLSRYEQCLFNMFDGQ